MPTYAPFAWLHTITFFVLPNITFVTKEDRESFRRSWNSTTKR
uniref:Uncharacterized protein n=1 Tax=uncultured bacterium A1Q1_fos_1870 TaxID=1256554 RepID=L7VY33_9BACT|nr:hypothetical protein [uncultured bacterium A1Q1_fos_1870]